MISQIVPLSAGNAIRATLQPPAGATRWRLLRKNSDDFTGEGDVAAHVVHDGTAQVVLDRTNLQNGQAYFYRLYALIGSEWIASDTEAGTPIATYDGVGEDALGLLRDRIEAGLRVEVERGALRPSSGVVMVRTAPPSTEDARFPIVSVHLNNESADARGIGDELSSSYIGDDGDWYDVTGWHAQTDIAVIAWCLNPDERIALRQSIRRVVQANLELFFEAGLTQVALSFSDVEDFERYDAPMYMAQGRFTCMAPYGVAMPTPAITDVQVTLTYP